MLQQAEQTYYTCEEERSAAPISVTVAVALRLCRLSPKDTALTLSSVWICTSIAAIYLSEIQSPHVKLLLEMKEKSYTLDMLYS